MFKNIQNSMAGFLRKLNFVSGRLMWVLLIMFFPVTAFCTNYYISSKGNDNNSGLSQAQPWQSIAQLNKQFINIHPGDSILFKRGDTFYGTITALVSGAAGRPIVFGAWGQGADPIITGFTLLRNWMQKDSMIWQTTLPGLPKELNMVTMNDVPCRIGRYPNADADDGGYLRYEDCFGKVSLTDNELPAGTDWAGAEIVIRKNHWTAERCRITAVQGNTIYYTWANTGINPLKAPSLYNGIKGNGYFIQNDARTLDQQGEWFYDKQTNTLLMVLGKKMPSTTVIKASCTDTLVNTGSLSHFRFEHLQFEGSNRSGIFNKDGGDISIQYCSFKNIAGRAVHCWATSDVNIEDSKFSDILSNAIQIRNSKKDNIIIRRCAIKRNGMYAGMGSYFDDRDYKAISVMANNNITIENNVIDSVGYTAIQFGGSHCSIQQNIVSNYCTVLDDGAGIYSFCDTFTVAANDIPTNRIINNNIVLYGIGCTDGSVSKAKAEGIYLDGMALNTSVLNNTIAFCSNKAIALNHPHNVIISGNHCFDNGGGWGATRLHSRFPFGNNSISNNIFFPLKQDQLLVNISYMGVNTPVTQSIWEAIQHIGRVDSNIYNPVNELGFAYNYSPAEGKNYVYPSPLTFEKWKELTELDSNSVKPGFTIPLYRLNKLSSGSLISGGKFETADNPFKTEGTGIKTNIDNSSRITGKGSLKIECNQPQPNRYIQVTGNIGYTDKTKKYILRFKTAGNSECGVVRTFIKITGEEDNGMEKHAGKPFGSEITQHEFLLVPGKSGNGSFVIEIEKNSCITYLDDIEIFEADAVLINPLQHIRFEYNTSNQNITIALDKKYVSADGMKYNNALTLAPFTSTILVEEAFVR